MARWTPGRQTLKGVTLPLLLLSRGRIL